MSQTIFEVFDELGISYELFDHPPFFTCAESEMWYTEHFTEESGNAKNLFLRDKKGKKHFLVVVESAKQVDIKGLTVRLGESNLSFASPERLKKYLNLTPGSVSPLALLFENAKSVQVIFDTDLLKNKKLHFHPPGRNDQTVVISSEDIRKFLEWTGNKVRFLKV